MQLRFATGGAAEGWARVRVAASPYLLGTEESVLHDMAHDTSTLARFVVVEAGEVLGIGRVRCHEGDEHSLAVDAHSRFTPGREHRISSVDPRTCPSPGAAPTGLGVATLGQAGARAVWACQVDVAGDRARRAATSGAS